MSRPELIPDILIRHAGESCEKVAFAGPGWTITYGDLEKRTRRLAAHLVHAGIGRGDFVAIVLGRCLQTVESVLAITRAGAVGVPLDSRSPSSELAKVLEHSGARVIITDGRYLTTVRTAAAEGSLIILSTEEIPKMDAIEGKHQIARYQDWIEDAEYSTLDIQIDNLREDEQAFLHYTSGTTSLPKGVLSNQRSWLLNVNSLVSAFELTPEDRFFWPLPLFHCIGHLLCIMGTVVVGASAYLPDADQTLFDSLRDTNAQETTLIVGAPTTFHDLMDAAKRSDPTSPLFLPRLRACMYAGSSASGSLGAQIKEYLGVPLLNNYGCTEGCGSIAVSRTGHTYRHNSSISLLPHWEIKLVDPDGHPVQDGEQGEVCIGGPGLMLEYYRETRTPFTPDGWYPTGDIAIRSSSAAGAELTLVGRRKEIIIRGGENIHPHELEHVLLRHPGVADVVVAGMPHRLLGETPAAFIVKSVANMDFDLSALLAACREVLPDYKIPTAFYEIDTVPRTVIGKPKRLTMTAYTNKPLTARSMLQSRDLIEALVMAETVSACTIDAGPESESNTDWLRRHFDQPFSFLGLSSMAGVVLRDRLAGLTGLDDLPNTLVFDYSTPAAVSTYLHGRLLGPKTAPLPSSTPTTKADSEVEPIAIVSMACRYPGGISSPEDLWQLVSDEIDATTDFPDDRGWDVESLYSTDPDTPNTSTTKRGGFLPDFARFDAGLFGMAPREALATDPQQRLLLETTWELAERGGIAPLSLQGSQTGVFVGTLYEDYEENGFGNDELEAHLGLGSSSSVVSGRVSYCFGLHGPSLVVSTGCSSSLVAIHLAAQSLRNRECSLTIAGGITTMATPRPFTMFSRRRGLSSDGRCRAYSSDASGTGWSEGVGLLLLERLSDAKRNGHQILGLIRGSAVNSDGKSNGLTAPNGPAQQMCIQSALAQAGMSPENVDVLEGHGTATPLGDPIEVQAVISAYGNGDRKNIDSARRSESLLLGSIKSNIGHTQAAAAVAGIIKMVQAMRHGVAPASLHIREPSPQIDWEGSGVELLSKARQWPSVNRPRRAAVSSFGIGGTNSHIILEQPEPVQMQDSTSKRISAAFPWLISGASEVALRAQAHSLLTAWREADSNTFSPLRNQEPADIAFSLATARSALKYRATVTYALGANMHNQIETTLERLAQGEPHPDVMTAHTNTTGNKPRLACLFSGQGSWMPTIDTLEELRATFPVFSAAFQAACDEVDMHLECPLVHAITDGSMLDRTDFAQATLFVFEVAMFRLLESFGIRPDFVAGHSLGEIAAAHAAGALSLRDAATIVTTRAKLMASLPPNGGMVSIAATEAEVAIELSQFDGIASIAAVNSQTSVVVSGTQEAIQAVADRFTSLGRRATVLRNVKHGFHSQLMDHILPGLENALPSSMESENPTTIPLVSTVTGKRAAAAQLRSSNHWIRHVSEPVRFADAVNELRSKEHVSVFVEIGPSAVLSPHVPDAAATHGTVDKLLGMLGQLWARGVPVDWQAVFDGSGARFVDLPVYAFQRQRYWLPYTPLLPVTSMGAVTEQAQERTSGVFGGSRLGHEMIFNATSIPGTGTIICSGYLSTARQLWLRDHIIGGQSLVPASAFTELALRAAQECAERSEISSLILDEMIVIASLDLSSAEDEEQGEPGEVEIQVLIGESQPEDAATQNQRTVDVYSRPRGVATQHEWTQHATGTFQLISQPNPSQESFINGTDPTKAESDVNISEAYAVLSGAGLTYGPSFQGVRAIWRLHDNDLLVQIDPPQDQSQMSTSILHPAVLDAALHASTLASAEKVASGDIRLPFSFRGIQVFEAVGASSPILARIHHIGENSFSMTMTDHSSGVVLAKISEVQLRTWQPTVAGGDLYRLEWIDFASKPTTSTTTDKIVRFESSHDVDATAVSKAVHEGLAEALHAVHEWRADKSPAADEVRLVFVTERATSTGGNSDIDLVAAAVWGFVRSAQAEFGGARVALIDLDGSSESEEALTAALVSREEIVAVHGGKTMIPRLGKQPSVTEPPQAMSLDVSGTVLITGGTGGLGAMLSRDIVHAHGAKSLLLVSRSGIEATGARELYDELRSANAAVRVEACDVSDRAQLAALLDNHNHHQYPPITTVIHCAGVVSDAFLGSQTPERVSSVLRPKVDAAWNLHDLVPDTVRSFVLFSSYVSVLGNEGQAAYSAGNAFLDALARFRVARGLPALSLAWGPWANDAGMAAGSKLDAIPPRIANARPFTDQQGLSLLYRALHMQATNPSEPVLLPLLLRGPFPLVPSAGPAYKTKTNAKRESGSSAVWRRNIAAVPSENRHDTLLGLVRDEIAAVLGYQGQDMLPDQRLDDLGFDSFTSVMLTNRLRVLTGLSYLPVTLALDYDTTTALVEYLLPRIEAEPQPEVDTDSDASTTAGDTSVSRDSGKEDELSPSSSVTTLALEEQDDLNPEIFRGLATIHRRLSQLEQYTAAADLLASAALAMPTFPKTGTVLSSYAAEPQRLATGPSASSNSELPLPLVFIAPFFPRIKIEGVGLSVYSNLASAMNGKRDVFELPHPEAQAVPSDLGTLADLHVHTIRKHFSDRPGIILAGYSAGGTVAYAVASKLANAESEQPRLAGFVLVDTYLTMTGRGDPDWLNALPAEALVSRLQVPPSLGHPKGMGSDSLVGDLDVALAKVGGYFRALRDWDIGLHPLPDALSTLFVRAVDPSDKMPKDTDVWRPRWPRADLTVDVPGSHLALLDKRYAPGAAGEIERWAREDLNA
ncbi:type I polyketide synthase [Aspergillus candidus]|uniref:Chalcone synthase cfoA n=1 Tax=Aspergillus candidus TaxID=41067 RepID=CFOA_ASPCN|nr:hypothetical protein BDW47DRAFT_128661 [Aspergillus candidus]A0A2I2F2N6.1 RecName: Full=Chalcone synthase cfoA; Short=CHS cfoA; AltName: Full=Chlorflavonin biosynthesis cluster protein A; AltName: Full=PKS-NRPS hybrid synthetase cfoA; Short=PKS-NRPS cfoA [Aspergillus candidus]PLB34856.1 hypothetical protein BDW47DRAFT_128661 [Aspergillus candidus]